MGVLSPGDMNQIAFIIEEGIYSNSNPANLEKAITCFEEHPDLEFLFGPEPSFLFASTVGALELAVICAEAPPANMRDLIDACRSFFAHEEGRKIVRLPIGFGYSINSPQFAKLTSRECVERKRRISKELDAVIDRVRREDPQKATRLITSMDKAANVANRIEDEEWQLAWVIESLEDDRFR
jgi:hypothetical protein